MLGQLKDVHAEMRAAIAELADVLSTRELDFQALAKTRMRLTRASGKWRTLVQCEILPRLNDVSPELNRQIADMRRESAEFGVKKSQHIARWSARAAEADPAGYMRASSEMRRLLLGRLDREAALFYPLLEAKAAAESAAA